MMHDPILPHEPVSASVAVTEAHLHAARELVAEARRHDGLAPLDLERFWAENDRALQDPWGADCPQLPLSIRMSRECFFAELNIPEDWHRLLHDAEWCFRLSGRYNDNAETIVGRRLLAETPPAPPDRHWPAPKALHDLFEAENRWQGASYWMHQAADNPDRLAALLDRVEKRLEEPRAFFLPPAWDREKARLENLGVPSPIYRSQRGPVTFAMSVYGVENLVFLILDQPDLAARFSDLIRRGILARARVLDVERGWTHPGEAQRGWGWNDDNCCLLNAEMYDFFALPITRALYEQYAPGPADRRFQHSDSDMAQHLPTFGRIGMNSVNFGPTLTIRQIREHLPKALISGQLAPFTFSRHEEVHIVAETIRDAEMARAARGVVFRTAGSINNGSRLTGLRLIMAAIQRFGGFC